MLNILLAADYQRFICKISLKEYAKTFKHPALRETLASFLPEGYSASSVFFALAAFTKGQALFALRMVDRYLTLGGTIEAPCETVDLIIIDRNKVRRVICNNGKTFTAQHTLDMMIF